MRLFDRSPAPLIDPASCILPRPDPVVVSRPSPNHLHLSWHIDADRVQIYSGSQPDQIDFKQPVATVTAETSLQLPDQNTAVRPYFALCFEGGDWHGRCQIVAERIIPLEGAVNFRDMGGYETSDGRTLAWGKLYRSGLLSQLTAHDLVYLQNLGLQLICDLRSQEEVEKRPDKLPTNSPPHYCHCPAQSLERSARLRGLTAVLFNRAKLEGLMDEGYTRIMIDDNAALIGDILKKLADPNQLPALIHCSAGKDRTAVIMALILSILNVPQDTILADYTLSNVDYEKVKMGIAQETNLLQRFGITVDHLQAVILVKAERLQKMFSHIQQKYGSVADYLGNAAGLNEAHFAQIKQNLLHSNTEGHRGNTEKNEGNIF